MMWLWLTILILALIFAIGEILVRWKVPPAREHYYRYDPVNKLFRRKPRLEGTFKKRNVQGYYVLNNEGWNSTRDYFKHKDPGVFRIGCIGSSETGAYEVDVKQAYPKILEDYLNNRGVKAEVYTFAADRAIGLGHALHLTRYAIRNFQPDMIIFNGAFSGELLYGTTTKSHYMLLNVDKNGKVTEVPPRNFQLPVMGRAWTPVGLLLQSRLVKYLRPKLAIRTRFKRFRKKFGNTIVPSATPAVENLSREERAEYLNRNYDLAIRYLLNEFRKIDESGKTKVLYVVKPLRDASFNWNDITTDKMRENKEQEIAYRVQLLKEFHLDYFELGDAFTRDFKQHGRKFDFLLNPHLNEHGHKVEGEAIGEFVMNHFFSNKGKTGS